MVESIGPSTKIFLYNFETKQVSLSLSLPLALSLSLSLSVSLARSHALTLSRSRTHTLCSAPNQVRGGFKADGQPMMNIDRSAWTGGA